MFPSRISIGYIFIFTFQKIWTWIEVRCTSISHRSGSYSLRLISIKPGKHWRTCKKCVISSWTIFSNTGRPTPNSRKTSWTSFRCSLQRSPSVPAMLKNIHHLRRLKHLLWRHEMETFSALLAFCAGNSPRSPVNSPHKGQRRGAFMFSLICTWTNSWANNRDAGDLRCHRAHYDVIVMLAVLFGPWRRLTMETLSALPAFLRKSAADWWIP